MDIHLHIGPHFWWFIGGFASGVVATFVAFAFVFRNAGPNF